MCSCKMEPKWNHCQKIVRKWNHGVKSCFSSPKYISAVPNRLNMLMPRSPVNFRQIREGHILPYHVTWSHRLKMTLSSHHFGTSLDAQGSSSDVVTDLGFGGACPDREN